MPKKDFFLKLGESGITFFTSVHEIIGLFSLTIRRIHKLWFYRRQLMEQLYSFSVDTLPIAAVLAIFVGLGSTIQGVYQSSGYVPRYFTINVIFKTTLIETAPLILALLLSGKIGAAVAAEIGSMRITEQIDALETTSLCPVGFLVLPKVIAALIMFPVMTLFANFFAMFSSFFVSSVLSGWISPSEFISGMKMDFRIFEITLGSLIKPGVFGVLISIIGSYFGLHTTGGARGVGRSATNAVVVSAVMVVIFDYYLGKLLL